MDWRQALETVIARTRHERYRDLCADDHPQHAAWRARMVDQATGVPPPPAAARPAPPPRPDVAGYLARMAVARRCPFRSTWPPCGCSGARCGLKLDPLGPVEAPRRGGVVRADECLSCVARYGL